MNKVTRGKVEKVIQSVEQSLQTIVFIKDNEEVLLDNTPESFINSKMYESREKAIDCLEYAIELLEGAIDNMKESVV